MASPVKDGQVALQGICARICDELRYTQSLDYAFTKLESWISELRSGSYGGNFMELGAELIDCVKDELIPIMANYSYEEVEALLRSPRFRTLSLFKAKLLELAREAEGRRAKPITRERYPLPPTAKERLYTAPRHGVSRRRGVLSRILGELRTAVAMLMIVMIVAAVVAAVLLR